MESGDIDMIQNLLRFSDGFVRKLTALLFSMALVMALLPVAALAATGDPEAFAVYDEGTKTLSFHKQEVVPAAGETFTGSDGVERTATAVYTGVETTAYSITGDFRPPWSIQDDISQDAERVEFVDEIAPISTSRWFWGKAKIADLDLSKLDTSNVTNMSMMFFNCSSLTSIDVSGFDTRNATDIRTMFSGCSSLTYIDLRSFDTSNVTAMPGMFNGCTSVIEIDLSSFDTSSVTLSPGGLFNNCSSLVTVYVGDKWNFEQYSTRVGQVFTGCVNLVGCMGTKYSTGSKFSYLRIDGGEQFPGYLSTHKKPIGSTEISGVDQEYVLSTDTVGPKPVIQDGDKVLQEGVDYTVDYALLTKNSKATLTITGIGEYGGYIIKTYKLYYGPKLPDSE